MFCLFPMILIYRILFLPLFIFLCPYFLWRTRGRRRDLSNWVERIGIYPRMASCDGKKRIWIHAVSVGEMQSIVPLVKLLHMNKHISLFISTTSTTGRQIAEKLYGKYAKITYFPIDFWPFVWSAWKRIRPDLVLSVDGELWPEHLHRAQKTGVPAGIINGRISERSFRRYCWVLEISRWMWGYISFVFACDELAARRIGKFIFRPSQIIGIGNLKCSRQPLLPLKKFERVMLLNSLGLPAFGIDKKQIRVLFGCSTWPGEEKLLLETFAKLRKIDANWRLILVPRHAERHEEIVELCKRGNFSFRLRSAGNAGMPWCDVSIVDTTGELAELIRVATIAFLGKTLPPNAGAQSPLDAAAAKVPLVCGPNYDNFHEVIESFHAVGAIKICRNIDMIKSALLQLALDEVEQRKMSAGMLRYLLRTKNVAQAIYEYIKKALAVC